MHKKQAAALYYRRFGLFCKSGKAGSACRLAVPVTFEACQCRRRPVPAVSAVELQDPPPEPQPSLILRRMAEGETLWDIAKQYRTDQDAIRSANELTEEARPEGMLLIPRVR